MELLLLICVIRNHYLCCYQSLSWSVVADRYCVLACVQCLRSCSADVCGWQVAIPRSCTMKHLIGCYILNSYELFAVNFIILQWIVSDLTAKQRNPCCNPLCNAKSRNVYVVIKKWLLLVVLEIVSIVSLWKLRFSTHQISWLGILLQCFDTVGWVTWPVKISSPNDLYCVEWDVKPYSTQHVQNCNWKCRIVWRLGVYRIWIFSIWPNNEYFTAVFGWIWIVVERKKKTNASR